MQAHKVFLLSGLLALAVVSGGGVAYRTLRAGAEVETGSSATVATVRDAGAPLHPVIIKQPAGRPRVATGLTNHHGEPVMASCSSCHATTKPRVDTRRAEDLLQFHQGLNYAHGDLTCLSCHNADHYDTLRLADGRALDYTDSMTLCSQCHGSQRRDYDRGLHGGMTGYWDLTRGGRVRSTCIQCHDPHAPAFPLVMPVLPPRDRISVPRAPDTAGASH